MLTTDLSAGTQNELPFRSRVWAFRAAEFAKLFHLDIEIFAAHLVCHVGGAEPQHQ